MANRPPNVFVSWSGTLSQRVGLVLWNWLSDVVQAVEPWHAKESIEKGTAWWEEMQRALDGTSYGIFCITPDNLDSKWLHFEAGAYGGRSGQRVAIVLFDVKPSDLVTPLSLFQATPLSDRDEMFKLVRELDAAVTDRPLTDDRLRRSFDVHWDRLQEQLGDLRRTVATEGGAQADKRRRSVEDMVEELLTLVREGQRVSRASESPRSRKAAPGQDRLRRLKFEALEDEARYEAEQEARWEAEEQLRRELEAQEAEEEHRRQVEELEAQERWEAEAQARLEGGNS